MATTTYVRLVVGLDGDDHRQLNGLFFASSALRDANRLTAEEDDRLDRIYHWFNTQLPVPPFAQQRWTSAAVSWFKSEAATAISRMWDLAAILSAHDLPIRMLRSHHPGKVVYEDRFQIVADQWRHL